MPYGYPQGSSSRFAPRLETHSGEIQSAHDPGVWNAQSAPYGSKRILPRGVFSEVLDQVWEATFVHWRSSHKIVPPLAWGGRHSLRAHAPCGTSASSFRLRHPN